MIGSCVHPHILAVDVSGLTVRDLCFAVSAQLAEAQRHEAVPFAALPLLGVTNVNAGDTRITFDSWRPAPRTHTDSIADTLVVAEGRQWVDLDVRFRDERDTFSIYVAYNTARYSASGVLSMLEAFVQLISCLISAMEHRASDVSA